jgi:hypothetical protein
MHVERLHINDEDNAREELDLEEVDGLCDDLKDMVQNQNSF